MKARDREGAAHCLQPIWCNLSKLRAITLKLYHVNQESTTAYA
jgi:hypothetical protein